MPIETRQVFRPTSVVVRPYKPKGKKWVCMFEYPHGSSFYPDPMYTWPEHWWYQRMANKTRIWGRD